VDGWDLIKWSSSNLEDFMIPLLMRFISLSFFLSYSVSANSQVERVQTEILSSLQNGLSPLEQLHTESDIKHYIDFIYDLIEENERELVSKSLPTLLELTQWELNDSTKYWLFVVLDRLGQLSFAHRSEITRIESSILQKNADQTLLALYFRYPLKGGLMLRPNDLKTLYPETTENWTRAQLGFYPQDRPRLQALFDNTHVPAGFRGGRFEHVPRLFVFCRHDRRYHCLMMMKDSNNQVVRDTRGRMWSMPVLALARQGKRYDERGGYTPSGVYTIDSVMPEADQVRKYGKYRRLIMNFIPRSPGENLLKEFLPENSHSYGWWRESVVARDIGRTALRIHGAGYKNYNIFSKHYPFVKTIGCIGTREGTYGRTTYHDQRILLDTMMKASGLAPIYENETKLFALLFVVEINNRKGPVTLDEMIWYLQRS
jgi:hypothetical protein